MTTKNATSLSFSKVHHLRNGQKSQISRENNKNKKQTLYFFNPKLEESFFYTHGAYWLFYIENVDKEAKNRKLNLLNLINPKKNTDFNSSNIFLTLPDDILCSYILPYIYLNDIFTIKRVDKYFYFTTYHKFEKNPKILKSLNLRCPVGYAISTYREKNNNGQIEHIFNHKDFRNSSSGLLKDTTFYINYYMLELLNIKHMDEFILNLKHPDEFDVSLRGDNEYFGNELLDFYFISHYYPLKNSILTLEVDGMFTFLQLHQYFVRRYVYNFNYYIKEIKIKITHTVMESQLNMHMNEFIKKLHIEIDIYTRVLHELLIKICNNYEIICEVEAQALFMWDTKNLKYVEDLTY